MPDILQAQRRIFSDNTTTAIAGHTYMSSWPSWPFLVRPVWYLFDKIGDDRISAVVFLGNPLILWPALIALAICLRDWIVTRRADAFLVLAFYFGPYLAWALLPRTLGFIYYYLPAATTASFALVYALRRGNTPRWLLWAYVAVGFAGFAAMLPISAAFIGTSMATFNRLMIFQNWILIREAASEEEPGNPVPVDAMAMNVRQIDRERLPIGVAPVVMARITPDHGAARASVVAGGAAGSAVFGAIDGRGTLTGASALVAAGLRGLGGVFGVARQRRADDEQGCQREAGEL